MELVLLKTGRVTARIALPIARLISLTIIAVTLVGTGVAGASSTTGTARLELDLPLTPALVARAAMTAGSNTVSGVSNLLGGLVFEYRPPLPLPAQEADMSIEAGRGWFSLGDSNEEQSLLLSSVAGPYPALRYTLTKRFGTSTADAFPTAVTYTRMWANLAETPGQTRWLGIHYLRLDLRPGLTIGAGEASIFDTHFPGDIAYYIVPLLPYYLTKKVPGLPSTHDNSLFYFDGRATLAGQTELFGAFLVNEFPMVPGAGNPALYAWQIELDNPRWSLAYTQVRHLAYSNGNPDLVYRFQGQPLGYPDGSDLDHLELTVPTLQLPAVQTQAGIFVRRAGEGKLDDWAADWNVWRQHQFLTGVVETWVGMHLHLRGNAIRSTAPASPRSSTASWSLDLKLGPVWNAGHQEGHVAHRSEVSLVVSAAL